MQRGFVYLFALILPAMMFAESFKVTVDREAHLGGAVLKPGEYRVTIDMGPNANGKVEFQKGKEKVTANVKEEKLDAKAAHGYIRYSNGAENRISEMVTRGASVRWLFP